MAVNPRKIGNDFMEDSALSKVLTGMLSRLETRLRKNTFNARAHNYAKQCQSIGHKEVEGKGKTDFQAQKYRKINQLTTRGKLQAAGDEKPQVHEKEAGEVKPAGYGFFPYFSREFENSRLKSSRDTAVIKT